MTAKCKFAMIYKQKGIVQKYMFIKYYMIYAYNGESVVM